MIYNNIWEGKERKTERFAIYEKTKKKKFTCIYIKKG